ncbi:hypothetical protein Lesp01_81410 [Lentzea sp. NBRC 102530]|nr:hypothetical protein Lesp01_81410 [Lentzea sp. NBRC 102530]
MHRARPLRRLLLRALAVIAAPVMALALATPAAHAYNLWQIESIAYPGYCLDSNSNGQAYLLPCQSGNTYQRWLVTDTGTNAYDGSDQKRFKNQATNRFLVMHWLGAGPVLETAPTAGSNNDSKLDGVGSSWANVAIRQSNVDSTNGRGDTCLHAYSRSNAVAWWCDGSGSQRWLVRNP